jgi:hypothetical protein
MSTRHFWVLVLLVFAMPALLAAATPIPGVTASPFGSQIVWAENPDLATYDNHLQSAGVKWARGEPIWWGMCEQTPGVYNFNVGSWNTDNWINQLKARGIAPYCILCYGNTLYGGTPNTPAGRAAYANFCTAVVSRYKDDVDVWEIWNEPNLEQFWGTTPNAADYAALVAAAAPAIRAADPDCIIVGGVTSGIDQTFLNTCFDNGMLQHVNVVSVHPYRIDKPESINSEIATLRTKMNTYAGGTSARIWTGEWGFNAGWTEMGPVGQAKMLSRMMVNNLTQGIELSIWFSVHGWATTEDWGLTDLSLNPRQSHQAMKVVNQRLPAPVRYMANPYSTTFTPTDSTFRAAVFERGDANHRTVALWRDKSLPIVNTALLANVRFTMSQDYEMRGYDGLSGNEIALDARWNLAGGTVTLDGFSMWDYPIFLTIDRESLPAGSRVTDGHIVGTGTDSDYPGQPASLAFDGVISAASKWTSQNTTVTHWLAAQLDNQYALTGFALRLPSLASEQSTYNATAVEFQVGDSISGPWGTVIAASNALQHDRIIASTSSPVVARFVRLLITGTGSDNYARIPEFEIYSTGIVPPTAVIWDEEPFSSDITTPQAGATTGWTPLTDNQDGQQTGYNSAWGALKVTISTGTGRPRINGWTSANSEWMPYTSVGTGNYVRAKFHVFRSGQANSADLNQVPNMRMRVSARFAMTSMLEVFNHLAGDTVGTSAGIDLLPSADPTSPSLYRVDFDPVDVPVMNDTANQGIARAFEAYALEDQENGDIALAESAIGIYPAYAVSGTGAPVLSERTFRTTSSDAGDLKVFNTTTDGPFLRKFVRIGPGLLGSELPLDGSGDPSYSEGAAGVTLDSTAVPSNRIAIALREFTEMGANTERVRVSGGCQYRIAWHVVSNTNTNTNPQLRLHARSLKFMWAQKLELGGALAAGQYNNVVAQQALPGVGCMNPDQRIAGETGGWYTMLMHTPISPDIRADQPFLVQQPPPGSPLPSIRDIKFAFDLIDTLSGSSTATRESGRFTLDGIHITEYPLIED